MKVTSFQGLSIVCVCVFASTCIMGGIIWIKYNSSENLPPALLLLYTAQELNNVDRITQCARQDTTHPSDGSLF